MGRFISVIRRPSLLVKYLLRERNVKKLIKVSDMELKKWLKEAEVLDAEMAQRVSSRRVMMLSPLRGQIVYALTRAIKPNIVVETGVASGASTYLILQALEFNGTPSAKLYSIDLPNQNLNVSSEQEVGWLVPERLRHRWCLLLGKSSEKLPRLLEKLGRIDIFIHDSEHTYENMMFEYETAYVHLRGKGLLLSDDIHWNNAFRDFARKVKPSKVVFFNGLGAMLKTSKEFASARG